MRFFAGLLLFSAVLLSGTPGFSQSSGNPPGSAGQVIESVDFKGTDIQTAFKDLENKSGLVITAAADLQGQITLCLQNAEARDVLKIILDANRLAAVEDKGVWRVISAAEYERETGEKFTGKSMARILPVKFIKPVDLAVKLERTKSPEGKVLLLADSSGVVVIDSPGKVLDMEEIARRMDVPKETVEYILKNIDGKSLVERIKKELTADAGQVSYNENDNKLIVTDQSENLPRLAQIISQADQPHNVSLVIKLARVELAEDYKQGIDWEAILSNYQRLGAAGGAGSARPLCSGILTAEDYNVLLDSLDTVGEIGFYPGPTFPGANNKETVIRWNPRQYGLEFNSAEQNSGALIEQGYFAVTPLVQADGSLRLKICGAGDSVAQPAVFEIKGDQVIILGGMFEKENIKSTRKFPVLGDLPFVGFAFRMQKTDLVKTEYVVFILPKIVPEKF